MLYYKLFNLQNKEKKFDERFDKDPYDDANFDCDEESFPATRLRNPNSEKSSARDDRSGKDPESIIPTSVESPRPKV